MDPFKIVSGIQEQVQKAVGQITEGFNPGDLVTTQPFPNPGGPQVLPEALQDILDKLFPGGVIKPDFDLPEICPPFPFPFPPCPGPGPIGGVIDGGTDTKPVGGTAEGLGGFQPLVDDIGRLNGEINDLREKLENASPEERMTIALELQAKQQERLQLMTTISNLLKQEHDAQMSAVNNLR